MYLVFFTSHLCFGFQDLYMKWCHLQVKIALYLLSGCLLSIYLISLNTTYSMILNKSGNVLSSSCRIQAENSPLLLNMMLALSFSYMSLIRLRKLSFISSLLSVFYYETALEYVSVLSASTEWVYSFYSFFFTSIMHYTDYFSYV